MPLETFPFDSAKYLDSDEAIAAYLDEAFKTQDPAFITHAIGVAARACGMNQIAKDSGDRRAYRIEDLPDDLAALLEAGLDELWNPATTVEDGDNIIG